MRKGINIFFISCLLLTFFLFLYFPIICQAEKIWQVGRDNDSIKEFVDSNMKIVEYEIPQDWDTKINEIEGTWRFPQTLYPFNNSEGKNPQEIRINFEYQNQYPVSLLVIDPIVYQNLSQSIEIYKGSEAKKETFVDRKMLDTPNIFYIFHIENTEEGRHKENKIILRTVLNQEDTTHEISPVRFDFLFLYRLDSDGDGMLDFDEGGGDWDKDEDVDTNDKDTVRIPIEWNSEKVIYLDIVEGEGESPSFRNVRFLDQNTLDLPYWLRSDRFLPYRVLGFRVEGFEPLSQISLQINYISRIYPSVQYHFYQGSDIWQEADFGFLDERTVTITIEDGKTGDSDGEHNGSISSIMVMSYPNSLGINMEKGSCFVAGLMN